MDTFTIAPNGQYKTHHLKTWPQYFQAVIDGKKKFEVRKNDRDFKPQDKLRLQEFDPNQGIFTGREYECDIHYILYGGEFGIKEGYCVMSLDNSPF